MTLNLKCHRHWPIKTFVACMVDDFIDLEILPRDTSRGTVVQRSWTKPSRRILPAAGRRNI